MSNPRSSAVVQLIHPTSHWNRKAAVTLAKHLDKPWEHHQGTQSDSRQEITPTASQQANPHSTQIIKYETAKGAKPLIKCQKYRKY